MYLETLLFYQLFRHGTLFFSDFSDFRKNARSSGFGANGSQKGAATEVFLGGQIMTSRTCVGIYYV